MDNLEINIGRWKCPGCKKLNASQPVRLVWNETVERYRQAADVKCKECGLPSVMVLEMTLEIKGAVQTIPNP